VLPLDGYDELAEFFGRFMKGAQEVRNPVMEPAG
jgi:hypothetical protein